MAFCAGCGNEVLDAEHCPICEAGRGGRKPVRKPAVGCGCYCPRCDEVLEQQDWDGITTLSCPNCRGTFFPDRSLEKVLDKLRATVDSTDIESVLRDFKDRFTRQLPDAVRYKKCPVCETVMMRRNYGTVSGVIVDACPDHGMWVDETQFAALADFICRGGDVLASAVSDVRARIKPKPRKDGEPGSGGLLEKFFG